MRLDNGSSKIASSSWPRKLEVTGECFAMRSIPACFALPVPAAQDAPRLLPRINTSARISADIKPCLHVLADFIVYLQYFVFPYTSNTLPSPPHAAAILCYFLHHGRTAPGIVANMPRRSRRLAEMRGVGRLGLLHDIRHLQDQS